VIASAQFAVQAKMMPLSGGIYPTVWLIQAIDFSQKFNGLGT
jgi:hypothetical protein